MSNKRVTVINSFDHTPVMLTEVMTMLHVQPHGVYVDCTLGRGGHSKAILTKLTTGKLYAFDQDEMAISSSHQFLQSFAGKYEVIKSNFNNLRQQLHQRNVDVVDGILYDLGFSSPQVDDDTRGFSYMKNAQLDMRMDQSQSLTAWHLVNNASYDDLITIIKNYGDEQYAALITKNIIKQRQNQPIDTTFDLVAIIKKALPAKALNKSHHPAKKTFQALRIAVNKELEVLQQSLQQALMLLKPHGRIVVISFHSLEDRIVKQIFNHKLVDPQQEVYRKLPIASTWKSNYQLLTKRPLVPTKKEIESNPRARSAKLRAIMYLKG